MKNLPVISDKGFVGRLVVVFDGIGVFGSCGCDLLGFEGQNALFYMQAARLARRDGSGGQTLLSLNTSRWDLSSAAWT